MMPKISNVYVIDVSVQMDHRATKHGVCVSVAEDKYLIINTEHREMYDDFKIESSVYSFLNGKDRFVGCFKLHNFPIDSIKRKVGSLCREDMLKIMDKIQNSKTLDRVEKNLVLSQLVKWLSDNP